MRVKIIHTFNEESLEAEINHFLECNDNRWNIIDIKYQTNSVGCYVGQYAMIIYEFKG